MLCLAPVIAMRICYLLRKVNRCCQSLFQVGDQGAKQRQVVPTVTGVGPLGQTMACLEMLARHHNVPFRRDVIERAAQDNLVNRKATSLELLGNLATAMGFTGTLVDLPEAKLARAPFPCIAWIEDQPAVLFSITQGVVQAVLPEYGRVQFSLGSLVGGSMQELDFCYCSGVVKPTTASLDFRGLCHRSVNIDAV